MRKYILFLLINIAAYSAIAQGITRIELLKSDSFIGLPSFLNCNPLPEINTFVKGEKVLNLGIGLGSTLYTGGSYTSRIPPVSASFEVGVKDNLFDIFSQSSLMSTIAEPRQGMATSDNGRFLRYWHEVNFSKINLNAYFGQINDLKWFPYNKGGAERKWYGNNEYVVNWKNDGYDIVADVPFAQKLLAIVWGEREHR